MIPLELRKTLRGKSAARKAGTEALKKVPESRDPSGYTVSPAAAATGTGTDRS